MPQRPYLPWIFGFGLALFMTVTPFLYYRWHYTTFRRLRVVEAGKVYRSGLMSVDGFEHAIKTYKIRTIINLMEEAPDPKLPKHYYARQFEKESAMCERLGVKMEFLLVNLNPRGLDKPVEPDTIENYLKLMDNPDNYPVLIHCKAGLHRTGCLVALYRMQYHGWSTFEALEELRAHGFGRTASYSSNEYISQYILEFQPRRGGTTGRLTSRTKE